LLAAIAQRNAPLIVKFGTQLLAPDHSASEEELAYLTTVTAAAHVRMGAMAQARSLLQAQWGRFNHAGQFDLALRDLQALTQADRHPYTNSQRPRSSEQASLKSD